MKVRFVSIAVSLVFLVIVGGEVCAQPDNASAHKAIRALYCQWNAVFKARDVDKYVVLEEKTIAPDYVEIGTDGKETGRQQSIEGMKQMLSEMKPPVRNVIHIRKITMQGKSTAVVLLKYEGGCTVAGSDGKLHRIARKGRDKETLVKTPKGWQWKRTEHLEVHTLMDGKPVNGEGADLTTAVKTGAFEKRE